MSKILVVSGSVRPGSVNKKMVAYVQSALEQRGEEVVVANLGELNLPFYNDPLPPSAPEFESHDEAVVAWTKLVADAEGIVLVTPEYNHTMSPVQLNAVDWIYKEWEDKPVALIGYGWRSGASQAHATAREALAVNLKANVIDTQTNLYLGKDLSPTGDVADEGAVAGKVAATLDELLETVADK